MRADPDLMQRLPSRGRRHSLSPGEIRDLVQIVRAGYDAPTNLERCGFVWRLRITINLPGGGSARRCFTIRDQATAEWVAAYLTDARNSWREHRRELSVEHRYRP